MSANTPAMKTLLWKNLSVTQGQKVLVSRIPLRGTSEIALHNHDFPEVFWVEKGTMHYEMNGKKMILGPNALITMRQTNDIHSYKAVEGDDAIFINVAFSPDVLKYFAQRYFAGNDGFWVKVGAALSMFSLSKTQIQFLSSAAARLAKSVNSNFETDFFIFNLLKELEFNETSFDFRYCPEWLADACRRMHAPENFAAGVPRLYQIAARSPEHTARVLKASTGMTPGRIVNAYRLEYASVQLRMTDKEIVEIGYECGFESLSHFYRVFKNHFKLSPGKYRKHNEMLHYPKKCV